jgi:hypothetical protein
MGWLGGQLWLSRLREVEADAGQVAPGDSARSSIAAREHHLLDSRSNGAQCSELERADRHIALEHRENDLGAIRRPRVLYGEWRLSVRRSFAEAGADESRARPAGLGFGRLVRPGSQPSGMSRVFQDC